jgi:DNA-binding transcriptional MerR regulator
MTISIPDKLYFKIGEVAKMADVPTHVLRYWESEFPLIKPKRANSKQRLYRRQDVELILKIKILLHQQGFTIAGARNLLASGQDIELVESQDDSTGGQVTGKLQTIKAELQQLQLLLESKK